MFTIWNCTCCHTGVLMYWAPASAGLFNSPFMLPTSIVYRRRRSNKLFLESSVGILNSSSLSPSLPLFSISDGLRKYFSRGWHRGGSDAAGANGGGEIGLG